MSEKRKDAKKRVLKEGEYQRSNGTYEYKWRDAKGDRHSTYAKTLGLVLKMATRPKGGSFPAKFRRFFLKYTKYSCEKSSSSRRKIPRLCAYSHF